MFEESNLCARGLAFDPAVGQAYNEPAFRHFLALERRRAERAKRSFFLLLVALEGHQGKTRLLRAPVATKVFGALESCLREVDFMGWYREGRIAGAVLTQGAQTPSSEVADRLADRVTATLRARLPRNSAARLQVRILQLRRSNGC